MKRATLYHLAYRAARIRDRLTGWKIGDAEESDRQPPERIPNLWGEVSYLDRILRDARAYNTIAQAEAQLWIKQSVEHWIGRNLPQAGQRMLTYRDQLNARRQYLCANYWWKPFSPHYFTDEEFQRRTDESPNERYLACRHNFLASIHNADDIFFIVEQYFKHFPAHGDQTAEELSGKFNNTLWNAALTYMQNTQDPRMMTPARMLYYLKKLEANHTAQSKLFVRGWYKRRVWTTFIDIPF